MGSNAGDRPDARTRLRYAALQLPGIFVVCLIAWGAVRWADVPPGLAYAGIALWILKDAVMFRFVWRAFNTRDDNGLHEIRGRIGTVEEALAPEGRVRVGSERWRAVGVPGETPPAIGERVRVVDIEGLRLTVSAASDSVT